MRLGKICKLVTDKRFGFIAGVDEEVFFHASAVQGLPFEQLQLDQQVHFEIQRRPRGDCASVVLPVVARPLAVLPPAAAG